MNPAHPRRRSTAGFAFLLAATGLGFCGYAGVQYWNQPHYSEADLARSAELNLRLDLAREAAQGSPTPQDPAEHASRLQQTRAELDKEIAAERQPALSWLLAGIALLVMAALRYWMRGGR